jgi:hypothetical protein
VPVSRKKLKRRVRVLHAQVEFLWQTVEKLASRVYQLEQRRRTAAAPGEERTE